MHYLYGIIIAIGVIFLIGAYIVPILASFITSFILKKTGRLDENQAFELGCHLYLIIGFLFGIAALFNYDFGKVDGFFAFIGIFLFWPVCIMFMEFAQPDGGTKLRWSVFILGFVLTQMSAIIMIINRSRRLAAEEIE